MVHVYASFEVFVMSDWNIVRPTGNALKYWKTDEPLPMTVQKPAFKAPAAFILTLR